MQKQTTIFSAFLILLLTASTAYGQLQSPDEFLGYELGDRWTPHHRVLDYVNHVAEQSEWVTVHSYGETYQHRELVYLVVTSPDNHENIEEIRLNNLRLTGLEEGEPTGLQRGVVWLSYNIHGNETSSSEAAMRTLHELVRPDNNEPKEWLQNTVVIMDPMLNPDGRERYTNWYNNMKGAEVNPKFDAREHHEPWPGGRSNHYMFDLNRDWAWQVQQESQYRYSAYKQWMPHVHVDFHEQSYTAPYYFAPAAEPFHTAITDWQREFQTTIGENHMRYFDEEGWLYFTRQRFDLFYPSFGDTWPTFHGSIGMTYEQAGHSLAGLAIETPEGDTLTLADRLLHHHTTGMSTVEVSSQHADRMIEEFRAHFDRGMNDPDSRYKTFVIKRDNHPDKIYNLLSYLDTLNIEYGTAGSSRNRDGFNFATTETSRVAIDSDDIIVSVYQPQSQLVRVLFEPNPELVDSLTYDITSWEAHYRFGLEGYALERQKTPEMNISADDFRSYEISGTEEPYAYVARWNTMDDARFLADITRQGVQSRFAELPFTMDGESFGKGSLVITRDNNRELGNRFDEIIRAAADKHSRNLHAAATGFVSTGADFGSSDVRFIEKPEVAVLMGEGTSSLSAGEVWHFFDHQLKYPATMLHTDYLMRADLDDYNVLVLPSGSYSDILDESGMEKVSQWIRSGGTLISIGNANRVLASQNGFQISQKTRVTENNDEEDTRLQSYGDRQRRAVSNSTSGSTFIVTLDTTHPLAFGYDEQYASLKNSPAAYDFLDSGWNVGTVRENAHLSGFAGQGAQELLENSLVFGVQSYGSGNVVYMVDNPLFRGFWENGKLIFVNAVFFVGN